MKKKMIPKKVSKKIDGRINCTVNTVAHMAQRKSKNTKAEK